MRLIVGGGDLCLPVSYSQGNYICTTDAGKLQGEGAGMDINIRPDLPDATRNCSLSDHE
jgi:hypothetical protein